MGFYGEPCSNIRVFAGHFFISAKLYVHLFLALINDNVKSEIDFITLVWDNGWHRLISSELDA